MCWIARKTAFGPNPYRKIAEKDKPVFKICLKDSEGIKSYFCFMKYEIGKTYSEEVKVKLFRRNNFYVIEEGLHCYSPQECSVIEQGIRIFVTSKKSSSPLERYVPSNHVFTTIKLNCIIPKGAEYYINPFGEIVTNQLKICEIDKLFYYVLEGK